MPKKSLLQIKESFIKLENLRKSQTTLKFEKRVIALQRLKSEDCGTREELANFLGISKRTLESWITAYTTKGIEELLKIKARRKGSKIITLEVHQGLKERVTDPENSFLGYWDAHRWVEQEYGVKVTYHWLRKYMINKFETKVKSARKSHVKKDKKAQASFLKTAEHDTIH